MIAAVVGGQFGSEGKGAVVGHIAGSFQVHVRVGAANAGHTVYDSEGAKHVLQQLPCAAYANPFAQLVLGAGAMITQHILHQETQANVEWRRQRQLPPLRLHVDKRAHVVMPWHIEQEQNTDLAERIGSTSTIAKEGIGAAQAARVMRTDYATAEGMLPSAMEVCDTVEMLHDAHIFGTNILLEGTQGTGLSNTTGFYPYVTSRNPTAAGLLADTGLGPADLQEVIMVARTFPIRVAGPSGPFWPDSCEISWPDVGIDPDCERTTVTKKVRRVATFSYDQIKQAARINSATQIALMFADYVDPGLRDKAGLQTADELAQHDYLSPMVDQIERTTGVPVAMLGTGPRTMIDRESALDVELPPLAT